MGIFRRNLNRNNSWLSWETVFVSKKILISETATPIFISINYFLQLHIFLNETRTRNISFSLETQSCKLFRANACIVYTTKFIYLFIYYCEWITLEHMLIMCDYFCWGYHSYQIYFDYENAVCFPTHSGQHWKKKIRSTWLFWGVNMTVIN